MALENPRFGLLKTVAKKLIEVAIFPLIIIIIVGDGVRFILWSFFSGMRTSYIILLKVMKEFLSGASSYFKGIAFKIARRGIPMWRLPTIQLPRVPVMSYQSRSKKTGQTKLHRGKKSKSRQATPSTFWSIPSFKSFSIGVLLTLLFVFLPYNTYVWLTKLPNPEILDERDIEVTTKIYDRNGNLLYEIYANENRTPVPLTQIPKYVKDATIAIEDRDFYRHQGFSIRGIIRASREIIFNNRIQGGSTITQQLIKSAVLSPEVKISRKLKELVLAFWAERIYTKEQILEMYFNQVPYGGTAWGIEAASQTFFGKSIRDVTLSEAALLAGLPAAPTEYSPFGNQPKKAIERQHLVLNRMLEDGYITKDQAVTAAAEPLNFTQQRIPIRAPHFVMYVTELLEDKFGSRIVSRGGLRVKTSLDITFQEKAEEIVSTEIAKLSSLRVGNGAALITSPGTGEILAMVGSRDYFDAENDGNVNITTSQQQPGSSIKVVNYAAALERGFTAATILDDSAAIFPNPGSTPYAPVNYDGRFHGLIPLRFALGNSYNIPAVKVLAKIGVPAMLDKGKLMGIDSWNDPSRYGLSLTLGGGEVTMLEMAKVYGTLANLGTRVDLHPILEVTDYTGRIIERNQTPTGIQVLKPEIAWILSNILSDNTARIAAFGPNSLLVIPGKTVSVKTGTTNEKRDNWTIGYTPSHVVVVWVGNNDNTPMNPFLTSGVTGAAPIWNKIITEALRDKPDQPPVKPDTVVAIPCHYGRTEYFVAGTEPTRGRCSPLPTPSTSPTPVR